MPKVSVTSHIELDMDELLEGLAQLEAGALEQFAEQVLALRARRRAVSVAPHEAALLQTINHGVPSEVRRRYAELNEALHEETLTSDEHQELLQLIERIELADAGRMRCLVELAQWRQISVDALMDQLGIRQSTHA